MEINENFVLGKPKQKLILLRLAVTTCTLARARRVTTHRVCSVYIVDRVACVCISRLAVHVVC